MRNFSSEADDPGFFKAMFDALIADGIGDAKRIYITGGSNDGMMTYRLVCQFADRIAGAGVLVATLPKSAPATRPKPSRPVPMIIMLGTVDPIVRYEGTAQSLSADATVAHWRQVNESAAESKKWDLADRDPKDGTRVHAERWEGKAHILFCQLEGHGHGWPMQIGRDETGTGPRIRDISAPDEFWKFFKSTNTSL